MDFIEHIFGTSPDGRSGLFEWLFLLTAIAVVAAPYLVKTLEIQAFVKKFRTLRQVKLDNVSYIRNSRRS